MELEKGLGNNDYSEINDKASEIGNKIASELENIDFYITGPAGIAGDTVKLFEQADFVLLLATVVIILVLLIAHLPFTITCIYSFTCNSHCLSGCESKCCLTRCWWFRNQ